ncbi:MAG: nicotinic acid mononucleotide adenylyltransferase, partial [Chloroflexi bacterium]|nr:nicotinic acid mononucleotide adenylyltransferase [Chloroflexota bacterium]
IRERVRAGRSLEGLVPEAVREYIAAEKLYRD